MYTHCHCDTERVRYVHEHTYTYTYGYLYVYVYACMYASTNIRMRPHRSDRVHGPRALMVCSARYSSLCGEVGSFAAILEKAAGLHRGCRLAAEQGCRPE